MQDSTKTDADATTGVRIRRKNLDRPDSERQFEHGTAGFVDLGPLAVGRAVLEPGWRWSVDIKPQVGSASCQIHHFHVVLAGRVGFRMDNGDEHEFGPADVMDIPPGHDAWVIGDEPATIIDIAGNVADFAVPLSHSRTVSTMLFTDIVGSTDLASRVGDAAWKQLLAEHDRVIRHQLERFGGREVNTTGDGFLAVFESAGAALLAGLAMRDGMVDIDLSIRVGVHSGEVELVGGDVRGLAVHAAARVMAAAGRSEVFASSVVRALAEGTGCRFEDRGDHALKGLSEPMRLFSVER